MKSTAKKGLYVLAIFSFFLIFVGFVLFLTFVESGLITFQEQPLSVAGFSCGPSGTDITLSKNVQQPVNLTGVIITAGNVSHSVLNSTYRVNSTVYSLYFPGYRCFSGGASDVRIYYQTYSSAPQPSQAADNFFSRLISDTKV